MRNGKDGTPAVHGTELIGPPPQELLLSDGSRLGFGDPGGSGDLIGWRRITPDGETHPVTIEQALSLAGDSFAGYVEVRTAAERHWLLAVGDWYRERSAMITAPRGYGDSGSSWASSGSA